MWKGLPGVGRHEMVVGRLNAAGVRKIRDGRAGRLKLPGSEDMRDGRAGRLNFYEVTWLRTGPLAPCSDGSF